MTLVKSSRWVPLSVYLDGLNARSQYPQLSSGWCSFHYVNLIADIIVKMYGVSRLNVFRGVINFIVINVSLRSWCCMMTCMMGQH